LKWSFETGAWIDSSPAIATDGTIYFGSWDTDFYALNPDGSKKWIFATGGIIDSSPAIGADGTIYFGSHDKTFYALTPDGKLLWKFLTQGQIISSPAINLDGTIYFTSTDGNLYAMKPDGIELWRLHTGGATESSPVLDGQGEIYLAANQFNIGVSEAGKKLWERGTADLTDVSPAVATNRFVYFSSPWHDLYALQPDNTFRWNVFEDSPLLTSPVIGGDGTIYVACAQKLYAVTSTSNLPPAMKSSWPMFRADARHTGRVQIVK